VIQLFGQERRALERFDALNRDHLAASQRSTLYFSLLFPVVGAVGAVATAAIVWYGGGQVLQGTLTLGVLVAFVQYLHRFYEPIRDLAEKYNILQQAMTAAERIFGLLDQAPEVRDPPRPRPLSAPRGEIVFEHVWFAYEDEHWVLRDIALRIAPGERVGVVGATGAGKTSLINLLARFYDPQRGRILLDGVDLRELDQATLRRQLGLVLQDPFLFAGTLAHNIRLSDSTIDDARVREAAQRVGAAAFIERLPGGYEHVVRERGSGLSTGQKQLIAFARALAHDPRVLLVLDEATSSVDAETEARISAALRELGRDRTVVAIAHRLSTVQEMDRIVVLHKGRVAEQGTHAELLARRGLYYRLWELQQHEALLRSA
jgi:ATP-binding cassette subfamily B protein